MMWLPDQCCCSAPDKLRQYGQHSRTDKVKVTIYKQTMTTRRYAQIVKYRVVSSRASKVLLSHLLPPTPTRQSVTFMKETEFLGHMFPSPLFSLLKQIFTCNKIQNYSEITQVGYVGLFSIAKKRSEYLQFLRVTKSTTKVTFYTSRESQLRTKPVLPTSTLKSFSCCQLISVFKTEHKDSPHDITALSRNNFQNQQPSEP